MACQEAGICHIVLLIGPPASGKSTLGDRLAERFGWTHVDVGARVREVARVQTPKEVEAAALSVVGAAIGAATAEPTAQTLLVNGFPRGMDGLQAWAERWPCGHIALALVLEAPHDILRARASARCRSGDRPEDSEVHFEERLQRYHEQTEEVIANITMAGQARFLDASASLQWVEQAAVSHFSKSVIFLCGEPAPEGVVGGVDQQSCAHLSLEEILRSCVQPEEPASHCPVPSKVAVQLIDATLAKHSVNKQVFLLEGFPRNAEDVEAWRSGAVEAQAVAAVHIGRRGTGPCRGCNSFVTALRRLCVAQCLDTELPPSELQSELVRTLRLSQPLSVAVPHGAAVLLQNWLATARCTRWWNLDHSAFEAYAKQLAACDPGARAALSAPKACATPEAWLVWLAHMLRSEAYESYCSKQLPAKRLVGPLPPPVNAHIVRAPLDSGLRGAAVPKVPPAPGDLKPAMVADAPGAFIDALVSFEQSGLGPFGDPRSFATPTPELLALLEILGLHYRRFLIALAMAGPESVAGPPKELDWLWHSHITHPQAYVSDCLRLFGRKIPHRPGRIGGRPSADEDLGVLLMDEVKQSLRVALVKQSLRTKMDSCSSGDGGGLSLPGADPADPPTDEDEAVIVLGCFFPGGDRAWLRSRLAAPGNSVGKALAADSAARPPQLLEESLMPDPTTAKVSVRTLGGDVVLDAKFAQDTQVRDLRGKIKAGENQDIKLFYEGRELMDADRLGEVGIVREGVVNLVRVQKPPPRPPSPVVRRRSPSTPRCCSCFTSDCVARVLTADGCEELRAFAKLEEGNLVRTGAWEPANRYRRITRIWACPVDGFTETVALSRHCRLTTGHPVFCSGQWRRPEDVGTRCQTWEDAVYTIELEGHVDTIVMGDVVCAALGVYCGEDFGWNVFTRKTRCCDVQPCLKCRKAVIEELDFTAVDEAAMAVRYEPY